MHCQTSHLLGFITFSRSGKSSGFACVQIPLSKDLGGSGGSWGSCSSFSPEGCFVACSELVDSGAVLFDLQPMNRVEQAIRIINDLRMAAKCMVQGFKI